MKKSLIANIGLIAASVFTLIFLALSYVGLSGYQIIAWIQYLASGDITITILTLLVLFTLVLAVAILAISIVALLGDLGVVKSEKAIAGLNKANFILSIIFAIIAIATMVMIIVLASTVGIGCILNTIFAVAALVFAILNKVWAKK